MQELSSVVGMVMSSDVYPGEQILRDRLIQIGETDSDRNTLAFTVEPGMRAMTIFVNEYTGLVNFLKPGNRVDIVASYAFESTRAVLNSEEGELEWILLPMVQMLEQNLKILAVGATMNKAGIHLRYPAGHPPGSAGDQRRPKLGRLPSSAPALPSGR